LEGDLSGEAVLEMVTFLTGFLPLAAMHLSQFGSLHGTIFFFNFEDGPRCGALVWWASLAPLSVVARRLLGPGAAATLSSTSVVDTFAAAFALTLAIESALAAVAWVRLEYPESELTSEVAAA
jgi:hypothetical protein